MNNAAEHPSHVKLYLTIFGALALLTGLTVGVSYVHMARPLVIGVGLAIAAIKVSLIVTFFMHLKQEKKIIHMLFFSALLLVMVLLFFVLPDLGWK